MRVGERSFVLSVSAGVTSLTMADTSKERKRRFGLVAYT